MDGLIQAINLWAPKWYSFIITSSVQFGIFLIIIYFVSLFFRNSSAIFLYSLWLIGLLKVFIPPSIKLPNFFVNTAITDKIPIFYMPAINAIPAKSTGFLYQNYLFIIWLTVVAVLLLYAIYKNIKLHFMLNSCQQFDKKIVARLNVNMDKRIRIFYGKQIFTPFTKGLFRTNIYVPEHATHWSERDLKAVILHEWAHIQRKDTIFIAFQNLVQVIYFFHPLVWLANMQISRYREKACDDYAVHSMKGNFIEYSKSLMNSIDRLVNWRPLFLTSNYFIQSKKFIFQRFDYILKKRKEANMIKLTHFQKVVVAALMVVALIFACKNNQNQPTEFSQKSNANTAAQHSDISTPPPIPAGVEFTDYDEAPQPVGGFKAIMQNLKYPELARKAGIEGRVSVAAYIDANGNITETKIAESLGENNGLNEAAIAALKSVKWLPAMKDDKPVNTWIVMPFHFKLKDESNLMPPPARIKTLESGEKDIKMMEMVPPPPPPVENGDEPIVFVPYDDPPMPVGGFAAIQKNLVYPEVARKAGVEGRVVAHLQIDLNGDIVNTKILKSLGDNGCDQAAINALKSVKWTPAKQRGKPLTVWISVPVVFKLQ